MYSEELWLKALWKAIEDAKNNAGVNWVALVGGSTSIAKKGIYNISMKKLVRMAELLETSPTALILDAEDYYEELLKEAKEEA